MHSSPGLSQVSLILTVSASDSSSAIYNEDCLKPLALRPMCLRVVKVLVLGLTVSPSAYWLNIMTCTLTGDQLPSFLASHKYDIVRIGSLNNSLNVTINAEAFKNLRTKRLGIFSFAYIIVKPGAFSGVADQFEELKIGRTLRPIPDDIFHGLG